MCIFTGPVVSVNATKIFVGDQADGRHGCVYSMNAQIGQPVAMVLPIPVAEQKEDSVEFVNLEKCKDFFKHLSACWSTTKGLSRGFGAASKMLSLKVHDVGQYIASFVPTGLHFKKLDERFRLKPETVATFSNYKHFGYVVFQLKDSANESEFHPMAFKYQSSNPNELFFPTVHIHDDGDYHKKADYDHTIYAQSKTDYDWETRGRFVWNKSDCFPKVYAEKFSEAQGLLNLERHLYKLDVVGQRANHDFIFAGDNSTTRSPVK